MITIFFIFLFLFSIRDVIIVNLYKKKIAIIYMSEGFQKVNNMFNVIESSIKNEKRVSDTEPYGSFKSGLNAVYDYFKVIFVSNKSNNERYESSLSNLDKQCDCSQYKCKNEEHVMDDQEEYDNIIEHVDIEGSENDEPIEEPHEEGKLLLKKGVF